MQDSPNTVNVEFYATFSCEIASGTVTVNESSGKEIIDISYDQQ